MDRATYEVGFARAEITAWEPEQCMLGWGMFYNRVEGVAEPLYARAMVLVDRDGTRFAYVCADLLLMSQAVRLAVLDDLERDYPELGLTPDRVMLTATHTHSGPAGYSHHFWVNIGGPGYSRRVTETVVQGVTEAIVAADRARRPGRLRFVQGAVPPDASIAFNRSWFAYNRNLDTEPVSFERRAEAVDATMSVLRFEPDPDPHTGARQGGGLISWFPAHGTCVHSQNRQLHPDHKGLASERFTAETGDFGIFAQEATGDVTPNHRLDRGRGLVVGRYDDDYESAAFVADVEADYARRLYEPNGRSRDAGLAVDGPLSAVIRHVNFSCAPLDRRFVEHPEAPATTRPARLGVSMAMGTAEGPGPLYRRRWLTRLCNGLARAADRLQGVRGARQHDPKWPMLDLSAGADGRFMGLLDVRSPLLLPVEPSTRYVKSLVETGALDGMPWMPEVVPLQLWRLGPVAIAAVPFEPTTVSGRRLRRTLLDALAPVGVQAVVINPYANAYAGYLTTFEEYQVQHYEAGYTLFGPWQLAALRTAFAGLAEPLGNGGGALGGPTPLRVDEDRMALQQYRKPWRAFGGV